MPNPYSLSPKALRNAEARRREYLEGEIYFYEKMLRTGKDSKRNPISEEQLRLITEHYQALRKRYKITDKDVFGILATHGGIGLLREGETF